MPKIIDTHCHFLTKDYVAALKRHGRIQEDGFPIPEWSLDMQLEYMETCGISHALLSLSTPHPHFGDDSFSAELCQSINEEAADLCRKYPGQLSFAACLPLPNVELAIQEMRYGFDRLGARAVKVPSQANGLYLGDETLRPLMAELDARAAVMIIHPSKPPVVPEGCFTSGPLPLLEFINDTTRAVVNLIATGALEEYPHVRVVVPHCGSFLPNIIDRLTGITRLLASKGMGRAVDVTKSLNSLYFDLAGDIYPRGISIVQTLADEKHLLFGGDFPYTPIPMIGEKVKKLLADEKLADIREKLLAENAEGLLGITFIS